MSAPMPPTAADVAMAEHLGAAAHAARITGAPILDPALVRLVGDAPPLSFRSVALLAAWRDGHHTAHLAAQRAPRRRMGVAA